MTDPTALTATLIVSSSSSTCGRCRRGTRIAPTRHDRIAEYGSAFGYPVPGCGAEFTAITTDQLGPATRLVGLVQSRPDLTLIIPEHMTIPGDPDAAEAERRMQVAVDGFRAAVLRWKDAGSDDPDLRKAGEQQWEVARAAADEFDTAIARLRRADVAVGDDA